MLFGCQFTLPNATESKILKEQDGRFLPLARYGLNTNKCHMFLFSIRHFLMDATWMDAEVRERLISFLSCTEDLFLLMLLLVCE